MLAAKRGAVPHLAVATEQGTVYIWDTSKREAFGGGQSFQSTRTSRVLTNYIRQTRSGTTLISMKTVYSIFGGLPTTHRWQLAPETTPPASPTLPAVKRYAFYADTPAP